MTLGHSVGEGGHLKLPILKNLACLAPPSGVMRQRTLSFWFIWIQCLVFSYGSKNQNSRLSSFWSMSDQSWKKTSKTAPRHVWPKIFQVHTSSHYNGQKESP